MSSERIKSWPTKERPRERLLAEGPERLTDADLLAIILRIGSGTFIPDIMSPFERIRRTNAVGFEHWSSRDFTSILGYTDYRNFESVIGEARLSCFNSGHRIEDHFIDITEKVAK